MSMIDCMAKRAAEDIADFLMSNIPMIGFYVPTNIEKWGFVKAGNASQRLQTKKRLKASQRLQTNVKCGEHWLC